MATIDPKLDNKNPKFNIKAYKHAISMIESSGGKFMEAGRGKDGKLLSSAAGKYHFLYKLIQKDPEMKGITKRQFMNNEKLQDRIMDKALNGNLAGFAYGTKYAEKLKNEYGSDHDVTSLTALVHFLGPGNARKYLKNPDKFIVPGTVNSTAGDYLKNFNKHFDEYNTDHPVGDITQINNTKIPQVVAPTATNAGVPTQGIQGTNPPSVSISKYPDTESSYDFNEFKQGGQMSPEGSELDGMSGADKLVTVFEGGGTHEQNSLGGIPQGAGSNGKPNLVEEGETKWNDYIFSNSYDMEGNYTGEDGKKSNVFEKGGNLIDPTDPPVKKNPTAFLDNEYLPMQQPQEKKKDLTLIKQNHPTNPSVTEEHIVPNVRDQYRSQQYPLKNPVLGDVDFKPLANEGSQSFLDRYNNPVTRERMKSQAGVSDEDIDNMIIKGLSAEKQIGGNSRGSKASYYNNKISMGKDYANDTSVESHERVHASNIDAAMGIPLMDVLGNAFKQEGMEFMKKNDPKVVEYMNQPHEAYGNFNEFREKLGIKPGQQLTKEELKNLVKTKGLGMDNFYRVFNDDNIVKALNTIAHQDKKISNNQEYRIS